MSKKTIGLYYGSLEILKKIKKTTSDSSYVCPLKDEDLDFSEELFRLTNW